MSTDERFFRLVLSEPQLAVVELALETLNAGDEDSAAETTETLAAVHAAEEVK